MKRRRFHPSKRIVELQTETLRRLHLVVFACYFLANVTACSVIFHLAPLSAVCVWYSSALVYCVQHLIATTAVILVITLVWWLVGNPAVWEQLCKTRQPVKVMVWSGVAGMGIDTAASLLIHFYSSGDLPTLWVPHDFSQWITTRLLVWAVAYSAAGSIQLILLQPKKRRPALDPLPKLPD